MAEPFEHRHYAHCESGVVTTLLRYHGFDLSEPMVFGIAGGLTFAFIPFVKITNMPLISYRMFPGAIIRGVDRNLNVRFKTRRYRSRKKALADLTALVDDGKLVGMQTSVYWLPYFPPEMRFQFNAHNLIVYGREGKEFLVSDPVFEHPVRINAADLQNARFARGTLAPKGFMYYPVRVDLAVDLYETIWKSIKRTARMMLHAPLPFIGVKGIRRMARQIEQLNNRQEPGYARLFLGHIVRMQEEIGTGGGGFRFMYAAFLQEAGNMMGSPGLLEASQMMTETGDAWRRFASACAKACKQRTGVFDTLGIAGLVRECEARERRVFTLLKSIKF